MTPRSPHCWSVSSSVSSTLPTRPAVVPFEMAAGGAEHVWVPFTKERIRNAPEVDPAAGLDPGREAEFCAHYEIAPDAGRSAALAGRDSESLSSVPA